MTKSEISDFVFNLFKFLTLSTFLLYKYGEILFLIYNLLEHTGVSIDIRTRNFTHSGIIITTCERSCVLWKEQIKNKM